MKQICKNCKYWQKRGKGYSTLDLDNYADCHSDKFNYQDPNKNENDNLVYADDEGFSAGVSTGENFGCIHFKSKNNKRKEQK